MKPLLFYYTLPCTGGDEENFERLIREGRIKNFLDKDSTPEEVRNYFFTVHNPREFSDKNLSHLVFPYEIVSIASRAIVSTLRQPFFPLPKSFALRNFERQQIENSPLRETQISEGGVIITHAQIVVDYATQSEISKYDFLYNENSHLRQPSS